MLSVSGTQAIESAQVLASSSPSIQISLALDVARRRFGLECERGQILSAERDQNLLLEGPHHLKFVMKISNPAEQREVTDFQTAALCHIETTAPDLPIPRVCRTIDGATEDVIALRDGRQATVRILSYLPGRPLSQSARSRRQRTNLAGCLARIDRGLETFSHAGQNHYLQWDITQIESVEHLATSIEDAEVRKLVCQVIADFRDKVAPVISSLRRQVIYNDLNFYNVLVCNDDPDQISGIIDFGDIIAAPLVNDVAVAASYQFGENASRDDAGEFIGAYHQVLPLTETELRLLPILIEARLALTLLITSYRAKRYPENSAYILRNHVPARRALASMRSRGLEANCSWIIDAVGHPL